MSDFWNGHHRVKSEGDTLFPGDLKPLPLPERFPSVEEAVEALFEVGYVVFPGILSSLEVAELRHRMDAMYILPKGESRLRDGHYDFDYRTAFELGDDPYRYFHW